MISDEELRELVTNRLEYDPTVSSDLMDIHVEDGIVTLSGEVESRDDRKWVEALIRQIPEIKDVINELTIGYDDSDYGPDVHHENL
jgi:osmotically-inducible protein OsmY